LNLQLKLNRMNKLPFCFSKYFVFEKSNDNIVVAFLKHGDIVATPYSVSWPKYKSNTILEHYSGYCQNNFTKQNLYKNVIFNDSCCQLKLAEADKFHASYVLCRVRARSVHVHFGTWLLRYSRGIAIKLTISELLSFLLKTAIIEFFLVVCHMFMISFGSNANVRCSDFFLLTTEETVIFSILSYDFVWVDVNCCLTGEDT